MPVDESQFMSTMSGYFKPRHDWRDATGRGVTVAIVDSGIDADHPELKGKVIESVDARVEGNRVFFDPSAEGDSAGHGTACAGIVAKIAPDAKFASIKVLGAGGLGDGQVFIAGLEPCDQATLQGHKSKFGYDQAAIFCPIARYARSGVPSRMYRRCCGQQSAATELSVRILVIADLGDKERGN
ncbi:MAG: S8 family serine peptidase [Chloracidobacterium sp.]|nr:S8 family serine peptidase [Chloracidobacterium sp.]